MPTTHNIKPISYLKANAAQIAKTLKTDNTPFIITQNGEAAMIVQSIEEYEQKENTIAMLQLIAQGEQDIASGNTVSKEKAFADIKEKLGL